MRAQRIHRYGSPRDLVLEEIPLPDPGPGEVRVDVEAAGVNYADLLVLAGLYQVRPEPPFSPGFEFAGRISALGPGVEGLAPGDRVVAMAWHGGFAEVAIAEQRRVYSIPDDVDAIEAASCFVAYGTAHHALGDRGRLREGELLLVTGATGGVGTAAVRLATSLGAGVIAAVGSPQEADLALDLGAVTVACYDPPHRLEEDVMEITAGTGVDVVLDVDGARSETRHTEPSPGAVGTCRWDIPRERSPRSRPTPSTGAPRVTVPPSNHLRHDRCRPARHAGCRAPPPRGSRSRARNDCRPSRGRAVRPRRRLIVR